MQNQRSVLPSMLALPRGGTTAPTTPFIALYDTHMHSRKSICGQNCCPMQNRKADTETAAQAVRCARTAQAVSPCPGELAVNHGGELPLRAAHKRVDNLRFPPSCESPSSLLPLVQTVDCVSVERTAEDFSSAFIAPIRISATILLHGRFTPRRRGITVPRNILPVPIIPILRV